MTDAIPHDPDADHAFEQWAPAAPPTTADVDVDRALERFSETSPDDLDGRLTAAEELHRSLQARLSDLDG